MMIRAICVICTSMQGTSGAHIYIVGRWQLFSVSAALRLSVSDHGVALIVQLLHHARMTGRCRSSRVHHQRHCATMFLHLRRRLLQRLYVSQSHDTSILRRRGVLRCRQITSLQRNHRHQRRTRFVTAVHQDPVLTVATSTWLLFHSHSLYPPSASLRLASLNVRSVNKVLSVICPATVTLMVCV